MFKRMLSCEMEEVSSGVIVVTDISPAAFEIILRYMYTGKMSQEVESDMMLHIIYGAEKYGLDELKNYCFAKLVTGLNEENAGVLAVAVLLYRAEERVKSAVLRFIQP